MTDELKECRAAFEGWFSARGGTAQPMFYYREALLSAWNAALQSRAKPAGVDIDLAVKKLMENAEEYSAPVNNFRAKRFAQICASVWDLPIKKDAK